MPTPNWQQGGFANPETAGPNVGYNPNAAAIHFTSGPAGSGDASIRGQGWTYGQGAGTAGGAGAAPGAAGASGSAGAAGGHQFGVGGSGFEAYRKALAQMGQTPTPEQEAMMQFGVAGAAAGRDVASIRREAEQRGDREAALGLVRDARTQYNRDPRRGATSDSQMKMLQTPVIDDATRNMMLGRGADANAGARRSAVDMAREQFGGAGGALMGATQSALRGEAEGNRASQLDLDIRRAEINRSGEERANQLATQGMTTEAANQAGFWNWESDLRAGTRYGLPDVGSYLDTAGLLEGQGGGAAGGAPAWGSAGSPIGGAGSGDRFAGTPGVGGVMHLQGGNTSGRVTENFGGARVTDPGGAWRQGMATSAMGQGGDSSIRVNNGQREMYDAASGEWVPAHDEGAGVQDLGQWGGSGAMPGLAVTPGGSTGAGMMPRPGRENDFMEPGAVGAATAGAGAAAGQPSPEQFMQQVLAGSPQAVAQLQELMSMMQGLGL